MKEKAVQRQQVSADKTYFTGAYGMGFRVVDKKTGEVKSTAPTLEQAEGNLGKLKEKYPGRKFEIIDNGYLDSKNYAEDWKFQVK